MEAFGSVNDCHVEKCLHDSHIEVLEVSTESFEC